MARGLLNLIVIAEFLAFTLAEGVNEETTGSTTSFAKTESPYPSALLSISSNDWATAFARLDESTVSVKYVFEFFDTVIVPRVT